MDALQLGPAQTGGLMQWHLYARESQEAPPLLAPQDRTYDNPSCPH